MVGLCGVLGRSHSDVERVLDDLTWSETEVQSSHFGTRIDIAGTFHPLLAGHTPARTDDGSALVWVWGDVYGYRPEDGSYTPRSGHRGSSAAYVADLYERHDRDLSFVTGLNGDFCIAVYDRRDDSLSLVTDRVATRPVFYTRTTDDAIAFASNIQSLVKFQGVDVQFDLEYLYEYLLLRRVYGVKTPLKGVEEIPPASVVTIDLTDLSMECEQYWRPHHDPVDKPLSWFVDQLTELLDQILSEWTTDGLDCGVLLSGGSDSRAVLAAMDQPTTAFHITDWMSREAQVAKRAAEANGTEFHLLERDETYQMQALLENPQLSNFSGWFDQAYFTGFSGEIADEVDVLVSGLYSDMLFKGGALSSPRFSLGTLGSVELPVWEGVDDVEDYIEQQTACAGDHPEYFSPPLDLEAVLEHNIDHEGDRVVSHGVEYESLRDLALYGDFFPMGADTDAIFSRSLMQMCPYRTPFLDMRILELQQQMPLRYQLRNNVIHRAISRLSDDLAEVPHSRTGVPIKYPFVVDYVGDYVNAFRRTHLSRSTPPKPHLTHGPWTDRAALIRHEEFMLDEFRDREGLIRDLPFFDYEAIVDCYQNHADGTNNAQILYSLATVLEMPVTEYARQSDTVASSVPLDLGGTNTAPVTPEVVTDE